MRVFLCLFILLLPAVPLSASEELPRPHGEFNVGTLPENLREGTAVAGPDAIYIFGRDQAANLLRIWRFVPPTDPTMGGGSTEIVATFPPGLIAQSYDARLLPVWVPSFGAFIVATVGPSGEDVVRVYEFSPATRMLTARPPVPGNGAVYAMAAAWFDESTAAIAYYGNIWGDRSSGYFYDLAYNSWHYESDAVSPPSTNQDSRYGCSFNDGRPRTFNVPSPSPPPPWAETYASTEWVIGDYYAEPVVQVNMDRLTLTIRASRDIHALYPHEDTAMCGVAYDSVREFAYIFLMSGTIVRFFPQTGEHEVAGSLSLNRVAPAVAKWGDGYYLFGGYSYYGGYNYHHTVTAWFP